MIVTLAQDVATVTMNQPENGNRIDSDMARALAETYRLISEYDGLRLAVLCANGDVFSVNDGCDPPQTAGATAVAGLKIPLLAVINGDATGLGLELALTADLRISVTAAKFGFPDMSRGVIPKNGGTQRLPRLVGPSWAKDMLLTGRIVDATEALSIGLVNRVEESRGQLAVLASEITEQISTASPISARYAKEAVGHGMDLSLEQGLGLEADLNIILQSTSDRAEGVKSFLEKRPPKFDGS